MRVAIIDIGTNTFNLLVAERAPADTLNIIHSEEQAVFLGRGGIEQGTITDEAMERGVAMLHTLVAQGRALGAARFHAFGTSALRSAWNATVFTARAKRELDLGITIIPGEEEAALILDGVRQAVTFTAKPMLVMDIGGGSIEFILATDRSLMWKRSFEIGATRLLERFAPSDPITLEEHFRIAAYLDAQLEPLFAVMDRHWPAALIGSAGPFDSIAGSIAGAGDGTLAPDATTISFSNVEFDALKDDLLSMSREERMRLSALPDYRVDTIPLALIAIERVLQQGITELHWSKYALKEGAARRALHAHG